MRFVRFVLPLVAAAPLIGCGSSETPVPDAAYDVHFTTPTGGGCIIMPHQGQLGTISTNQRTAVVSDGDGASISCSVTGSGTFAIEASAINGADSLDIVINSISSAATSAMPAKGSISYSSKQTAGNAYRSAGDSPCSFYFIPGTGEGLDAGKIWVAFTCPKIIYDTYTCATGESVAIFENCNTGQ